MRVLHVINSLAAGGAERLVADLAASMARGQGQHGMAPGEEPQTAPEIIVYALDVRADVFSAGLRAAGVEVAFARTDGASIYSPARMMELRAIIKARRPDIVHSHLGPSFHWAALAAALLSGEPTAESGRRKPVLVTTEHAVHNRRMNMPLARGFERWCYGRYRTIACVSPQVAAALGNWLGLGPDRLPMIPDGVEAARFRDAEPDPELRAWAAGRSLLCMTARFVPAKDHDTALAALALLPDRFAMVFIGDGPGRSGAEAKAAAMGLQGRVRFEGTRHDIPRLLAACDMYVQTSVSEGFGIACLEAMAAGLPVVASAAGGLVPLVEGAGLLFPPRDAAACADAILRIADDAALRAAIIAAQEKRTLRYTIDGIARSYLDLYREALR